MGNAPHSDQHLLRSIQQLLNSPRLRENLEALFIEVLHWGNPQAASQPVQVGVPIKRTLTLIPIAQLGSLPVYRLDWHRDKPPTLTQRRAVQRALKPVAVEHLICYVTADGQQASFVWARPRQDDRGKAQKIELRNLPYEVGSPARTTIERLAKLAFAYDDFDVFGEPQIGTVTDKLNAAFDVEAVTRQFFWSYREAFEEVERQITGITGDALRLFTQKLFNRLMFIVFLERKRWLSFQRRRDYLRALWQDHQAERASAPTLDFYYSRLHPLFFAGLNTQHEVDLMRINRGGFLATRIGHVPYLNGGLFEQTEDDRDSGIIVPDEALGLVINELLYRFNFTVTESTPLDIEVAVDPEMLGKIFEELVTGRHESGSYYTRKPVVAFMCREALKEYLGGAVPLETDEAVARFVDERAAEGIVDPEGVLEALRQVRVCDPACGSGAYLIGMLHELLDLRACLFVSRQVDARTTYERKLEVLQHNLYGVDVDPFAVNIARLRLWLSLVVDYEDGKPPPLPNLDLKIEVGDSLMAPDPSGRSGLDMFRQDQIRRYHLLKESYLRAHHGEKISLRSEIDQLRDAIARWARPRGQVEGFDWAVELAEVFADEGFDIVVMNPPYVSANRIPGSQRAAFQRYMRELRPRFGFSSDLYVHFLYRGIQLLKSGGSLYAITSNTYLTNTTKEHLRRHLLQHSLRLLMPLGPDVFGAVVYSGILGVRRDRQEGVDYQVSFLNGRDLTVQEVESAGALRSQALSIPASEYERSFAAIFFEPTEANRRLFSSLLSANGIVSFGERRFVPLKRVAPALDTGIHSGNVRHKLFYRECPRHRALPRLIQGRQVIRYGVWWASPKARYCHVDVDYEADPNKKGIGRGGKPSGRGEYWHFCGPIENHHVVERLLMRQTQDEPFVGYIHQGEEHVYTDNTLHTLLLTQYGRDLGLGYRYLLAILNSSTLGRIYQAMAQEEGRTLAQVKTTIVNRLPIAVPSASERSELESLVLHIQRVQEEGLPLSNEAEERIASLQTRIDRKVSAMYASAVQNS